MKLHSLPPATMPEPDDPPADTGCGRVLALLMWALVSLAGGGGVAGPRRMMQFSMQCAAKEAAKHEYR